MKKEMELKTYPATVGAMSLIGVGKNRPVSWGNYFWLNQRNGPRVINMWAENLEHLVETEILDDRMIRGYEIIEDDKKWFLVHDERVPENYLYQKLCFTGYYQFSTDSASQVFELIGDPTNELEQWTDPVSYYAKRGQTYNPETGIITYRVKAQERTLKSEWVSINEQDD